MVAGYFQRQQKERMSRQDADIKRLPGGKRGPTRPDMGIVDGRNVEQQGQRKGTHIPEPASSSAQQRQHSPRSALSISCN